MKRSGLLAIDGTAATGFFFFNYNGLCGIHQNSIHLEEEATHAATPANHVLSR